MGSYKEQMFVSEFKSFLDERVDCRLEAMLTEDDRTANHEDRTAELESKIEELESQIEYYSDHEDRITDLENSLEALSKSEILNDIDRRVNELMTSGRIRLYISAPPVG